MIGDKKVATTDLSEQVKLYTMEKTGKRVYHRPKSMFDKTTALPAIEYPHPGTSYNPTFEDHQALVNKACEVEVKELSKEAKIRRQIGPMFTKISVVQKDSNWMSEITQGLADEEIMLVKEHIVDTTMVDNVQAISMIQSALTAVRTPTLELIRELITLVKTQLKPLAAERTILYNIAIVQTSNLIHKSCICPSKS